MAELHELRPAVGSHQTSKRKGRGPGSGKGKTAGRGENGQKSRSGGSIRPGFEGGQMPLQRRIPKRGFTPYKRHVYQIVNVGELSRVEGTSVNAQTLRDAGLIRSSKGLIKILAMGELSQAYSVEAHKFSGGAATKIEAAGGSVSTLVPVARAAAVAPEPAVKAEPAPAPEVKTATETAAEPETAGEADAAAEPETAGEADAAEEPETASAHDPEPVADSKSDADSKSEMDSDSEADSDSDVDPEAADDSDSTEAENDG